MIKVLIWFGIIAVVLFVLLVVWSLLRAGAMADERMETIIYKEFHQKSNEEQQVWQEEESDE